MISTRYIRFLFLALTFTVGMISIIAVFDGMTSKPTDGLIWRLGLDHVIVESIVTAGPGEKAGLKVGDQILGINHVLVRNPGEAASILMGLQIGFRIPYLIQRGDEIITLELTPHPYRTGDNTLLYSALVGFVFLGVGLYTCLKQPNSPPARIFLLMNLCFLLVLTCSFRGSPYYWIDLLVQNAASWGLTFLGPLFLHFFLLFPKRKPILNRFKALIPALYLIPWIRHFAYTLSQYFGGGLWEQELFGVQIELWAILGIYLIAGLWALMHSYLSTTDPLERRQIKLVLWGTFIGLSPFMIFSVLGAGIFEQRNLFSIGVVPLAVIPLSFAYSIIRYRLLRIQVIIKRSILYSLLTGLFIGVYMVIVHVLGGWVERVTPFGGGFFGVLFVLVFAISFEPVRSRLQQVINRLFFRSDYHRQSTLDKLSRSFRNIEEMGKLARATLHAVDEIFQPEKSSLSIITDRPGAIEVNQFTLQKGKTDERIYKLNEDEPVDFAAEFIQCNGKNITTDNIHIGGVQGVQLERSPDHLKLPIFSHDKIVGLLSLDAKRSGEKYAINELEALEAFCGQAGLAIENIQLLKSIFEANQRLFEAEKLVSLGQLASGVAHEIRNPLSSIKLNIQGLARNMRPDQMNKRRLDIIQREIDHLDHIVHDVLIYARPSGLKIEPVQPEEVIYRTAELLSPDLKAAEHKIVLNFPENFPKVAADREKLHQICKNLIVNAADAMGTKGRLEITGRVFSGKVDLIFNDNGPGIAEEDVSSIFNPFFTTKADGTGLGLANAQKFIQEMNGEITVKSTLKEGAEFTITLPVYQEKKLEK
ncbi:hypothetical protein CEE37_10555 [candidate division LCP-89 bacterium B3_LCP]|uniref:histidine kinase n=1 Tax=candidate division LCP-89 bacterium B3_LCP TaxID=2012998 RepID=A0A532UXP5_UNCL8|nr:MAG: hypothetical protein CEE37_10555 [candidate division LCP-89 bacterium B3_LCP]